MNADFYSDVWEEVTKLKPGKGLIKTKEGKWKCNAVRLNNNGITDFTGFIKTFKGALHNFETLSWLDVSFNDIHIIPTVGNISI